MIIFGEGCAWELVLGGVTYLARSVALLLGVTILLSIARGEHASCRLVRETLDHVRLLTTTSLLKEVLARTSAIVAQACLALIHRLDLFETVVV